MSRSSARPCWRRPGAAGPDAGRRKAQQRYDSEIADAATAARCASAGARRLRARRRQRRWTAPAAAAPGAMLADGRATSSRRPARRRLQRLDRCRPHAVDTLPAIAPRRVIARHHAHADDDARRRLRDSCAGSTRPITRPLRRCAFAGAALRPAASRARAWLERSLQPRHAPAMRSPCAGVISRQQFAERGWPAPETMYCQR